MEQAKKKKIEIKTVSEIYGTTLNEPTFTLQESQKQKREGNGLRKYFQRLELKVFPT